MSEEEHFQWRLFFPLTSTDEQTSREKHLCIAPFTLMTKLNMLAITDEKDSHQSSYTDIYYPLDNTDVCLKIHDIERVTQLRVEIEIRNRQKESPSSSVAIQHWSIYEIKYPRLILPDKILTRLDPSTVEKITKCLQLLNDDETFLQRFDSSMIRVQKSLSTWQVTDSDRQIEESDIHLLTNDDFLPKSWRTLAIQSADHEKLLKTLTTLQIEEDKDLLDYFSFLISQTHFDSFSRHSQAQLLPTRLSSEKAYMSLLTMSYAAFIELIQSQRSSDEEV